jgi:hypothetical protein
MVFSDDRTTNDALLNTLGEELSAGMGAILCDRGQ